MLFLRHDIYLPYPTSFHFIKIITVNIKRADQTSLKQYYFLFSQKLELEYMTIFTMR